MATYVELYDLAGNLIQTDKKIVTAITIKSNLLAKLATPTALQKTFARAALQDPRTYLSTIRNYLLADFNASTVVAISGATDAQVQTAVNAAVDTLLGV